MTTATIPKWTLADRLLKARRHANLSQGDLAEYLGLSKRAISSFETGTRSPRIGYLRLWAERCGIELEWLTVNENSLTDAEVIKSRCLWDRQFIRPSAA